MNATLSGVGPSTEVARSQPQSLQREMRFLGEVRRPDYAEQRLLERCETFLHAIHLCIQLSRYKKTYALCDDLGIDRGHWSRMMNGTAHFHTNKLPELMRLCGNYAPLQWLAMASGQEIAMDQRSLRIQQLRGELANLEGRAA